MENPTISIIVAIAKNGVIGVSGDLPWRLSSDLKRFKRDTMGKPIIMGRKTWESIGKPLPGRTNVVVTRNKDYIAEGAKIVSSLKEALALGKEVLEINEGDNEICIIGGGQLYEEAMAFANRLYVTHVMAKPDGDTWFPEIKPDEWAPIERQEFPAGEKDNFATLYVVYKRLGT